MLHNGERVRHPNRIRELRDKLGLTAKETAFRCAPPTTESQIVKLEKSRTSLSQGWMYRLAPALSCRPWDILPEAATMRPIDEVKALWPQLTAAERVAFAVELSLTLPSGLPPPATPQKDQEPAPQPSAAAPPKPSEARPAAPAEAPAELVKLVDIVWETDGRCILTIFKTGSHAIVVPVAPQRRQAED